MAIQQGRNYTEAFDTASILTEISNKKMPFLPSIGTSTDLVELNMALVDIDTSQQRYKEARERIAFLTSDEKLVKSTIFRPNVEYRLGVLDVLEYKIEDAKKHLESVLETAKNVDQKLLMANASFQLAKANQFGGDHSRALELYLNTAKLYEALPDKFGLLRSYNNIAMIYSDNNDDDKARLYFNKEQSIAREVGDELGYARATNNLAIIEKKERNYPAAIRLATDALGVFKQQNNLLGIITAENTLSNAYEAQKQYPEAVSYAKQNLDASIELRELRGVATACGTLSNIYEDVGDYSEMAFASLCAATLIKELNIENIPNLNIDYNVFERRMKEYIKVYIKDNSDKIDAMEVQERRVEEILVKLNLGTDVMRTELLALKN